MSNTEFTNEVLGLLAERGMLIEGVSADVIEDFDRYLNALLQVQRLRMPKLFRIDLPVVNDAKPSDRSNDESIEER